MQKEGSMDNVSKTQWHAPFCAATELALREDPGLFEIDKEHQLGQKPLAPDLLIIKKTADKEPHNQIAKIFRGHNILEYKSPKDSMNIDTLYKVIAYASLYKSLGEHVNERKVEDITITLVRENAPRELFRTLTRDHGFTLTEPYPGIWYVAGNIPFAAQFISTRKLTGDNNYWLRCLTGKADEALVEEFINRHETLQTPGELENADAVFTLLAKENKRLLKNGLTEDKVMMTPTIARFILQDELKEKDDLIAEQGHEISEAKAENSRLVDEVHRLREQLAALQGS